MTIRKTPSLSTPTGNLTQPPAGLPSRNPSKSYWLKDLSPTLVGHRSTPDLPEEADVVIVGSGITGAFAARFLLEGENGGNGAGSAGSEVKSGEGKKVVMLEAREACSGATGRNGGHCQPLVYGAVPAVVAFELEVYAFLERFVKEEGVDCDWVSLSGVHAFLSDRMFEVAVAEAEQLQQTHPELAAQLEVVRPSFASGSSTTDETKPTLASLRVPSARGVVIQQKAASLWPYKLVASVLERLIVRHPAPRFNLQTNTPVTSLDRAESGTGWTLTTPRGQITARQVLLATNGYTSHLLPAFSDLIVPVRGQIGAILPPQPTPESTFPTTSTSASSPAKLTHSYSFIAEVETDTDTDSNGSLLTSASASAPRDDYLVQRPLPNGELIYGGGRRLARGLGVGEWRDDEVEEDVARYLKGSLSPPLDLASSACSTGYPAEKGATGQQHLDATFEWTGVMGFSRDHHAWVGPVPESLGGGEGPDGGGLFVCAGYTGHGMPAAALSAREVVRQMTGRVVVRQTGEGEKKEAEFPVEFLASEERVNQARGFPHVTQGW